MYDMLCLFPLHQQEVEEVSECLVWTPLRYISHRHGMASPYRTTETGGSIINHPTKNDDDSSVRLGPRSIHGWTLSMYICTQ